VIRLIYTTIIVPFSSVTDLQIVIADTVDGCFDGRFITVRRGIPSGEEQGSN
jgi:hypothetical protein